MKDQGSFRGALLCRPQIHMLQGRTQNDNCARPHPYLSRPLPLLPESCLVSILSLSCRLWSPGLKNGATSI